MTSNIVECTVCGKRNRVPPAASGTPRCANCHSPLPWMADADDATFDDVAAKASIPVLLDLWAPWCGPCRIVSPALETLAREMAGKVKLVKVDVDRSPNIAGRFRAQSIPMLVVLHRGEVMATQIGAAPERALRAWLEGALAKVAAAQT